MDILTIRGTTARANPQTGGRSIPTPRNRQRGAALMLGCCHKGKFTGTYTSRFGGQLIAAF
jgi:hypothetical protein